MNFADVCRGIAPPPNPGMGASRKAHKCSTRPGCIFRWLPLVQRASGRLVKVFADDGFAEPACGVECGKSMKAISHAFVVMLDTPNGRADKSCARREFAPRVGERTTCLDERTALALKLYHQKKIAVIGCLRMSGQDEEVRARERDHPQSLAAQDMTKQSTAE